MERQERLDAAAEERFYENQNQLQRQLLEWERKRAEEEDRRAEADRRDRQTFQTALLGSITELLKVMQNSNQNPGPAYVAPPASNQHVPAPVATPGLRPCPPPRFATGVSSPNNTPASAYTQQWSPTTQQSQYRQEGNSNTEEPMTPQRRGNGLPRTLETSVLDIDSRYLYLP